MAHLLLVCGSSKEIQDARVSLGLIPNLVSLRLSFLPIKQHIQISLEHALRLQQDRCAQVVVLSPAATSRHRTDSVLMRYPTIRECNLPAIQRFLTLNTILVKGLHASLNDDQDL